MHQPDICMLQSHKDPTLREQQLQHVCWNARNSKCNTKHGALAALLKAQDNLEIVINCLTVYETCTECPVPHKRAQPCFTTQTGIPLYQRLRQKLSSHHWNCTDAWNGTLKSCSNVSLQSSLYRKELLGKTKNHLRKQIRTEDTPHPKGMPLP